MAGKISEYTNAVATFADGDLVDVSKRISPSPDTFQSQKLELAQFQAFIQANASNILNTNGLTLGGNYSHNLNSNYLTFTNGTLNIEQGSLLVRAETNLGSTTVLFSKLNGDTMFNFLDNGNIIVGSSPVVTLTDTLGIKTANTTSGFYVEKSTTADKVFEVRGNGSGNWFSTSSNYIGIGEGVALTHSRFTNDGLDIYEGGVRKFRFQSGGNELINLFEDGSINGTGSHFVINSNAVIGSEKISLQSSTAIKGIGTSGSSVLAIYDNDTTPVKLWDFLDNGNVSVTQSSSFLLSAQKTFKIDGSSNINTAKVFEVNSGTNAFGQGSFTVGTYGDLIVQGRNSNGNFKVLTILGNEYFTLDGNGNNSTLRTKAFDIGTSTTTGYKMSFDAGRHQLVRNGIVGGYFDLVNSKIQFWEAGMTSRKFIVGGSALIGTEKISLQDDTLLNANVNMPNLPTSATGLSSGDLWNDGGTVKIV